MCSYISYSKEKSLNEAEEAAHNAKEFVNIDTLALQICDSALAKHGLSREVSLEERLQKRKEVYWDIFEAVQSTAEGYYADKLKEERFQLRKSSAANLEMMTPEMRQKEEELYLKKLDDEWKLRGTSS